jgi:glucose-1-phosphate adenylyltransferase
MDAAAANPSGPFVRKQSTLKCLSPKPGYRYAGTADAVLQNLWMLEREGPEFVLILSADHAYKMDYTQLLRSHADSGAHLTVAAVEYPKRMATGFGVLEVNSEGEVLAFKEKPDDPKPLPGNPNMALVSMGIYVFETRALVRAVIEDTWKVRSEHDFGRDIIPASIGSLRVHAYNFTAESHSRGGYWRDIGTIDDYYRSQMELLLMDPPFDPYNDALCPTYAFGESNSAAASLVKRYDRNSAVDSVISNHSMIYGARIAQSVISRDVHVGSSADIESSVLLPGVRIGRGARIRRAVIDEDAVIPDGSEIGYSAETDRQQFQVSCGGVVVVPREIDLTACNCVGAAF